ncbi:MAG: BNR-4 repeat-containing protein [Planctomycetales bacterium]|nr:BNR-4 repeat-containing protein [Planctomycetales bacterium]
MAKLLRSRSVGFALLIAVASGQVFALDPVELTDDGGWCWFQDERAIVCGDKLVVGSVATGGDDKSRVGDVQAVVFDLLTGDKQLVELHDRLGADDHNAPAFAVLPGQRLLAIYATHGATNSFWYRVSAGGDFTQWSEAREFVPTSDSRITYSNVFRLRGERGRVFNFYRGYAASFKPSFATSDDEGESWQNGGVFLRVPDEFRHRPYVKYASDGVDTIHMVYTNGHPRNYDNSLYHAFYRAGKLHRSDGEKIASLEQGIDRPELGTLVFAGDAENVAWPCDLHLDAEGRPVVVYSVQKDRPGLPPGAPQSGADHRYRYAAWNGSGWLDAEMAFAGSRLYPKEDDYTGLACLDPDDVSTVYISTNAQPATGEPLVSDADGRRHYEIFRAKTADGGNSWTWTAVTRNSTTDNLRPMVPKWRREKTALLWLRGTMRTYTDYELSPMVLVVEAGGD